MLFLFCFFFWDENFLIIINSKDIRFGGSALPFFNLKKKTRFNYHFQEIFVSIWTSRRGQWEWDVLSEELRTLNVTILPILSLLSHEHSNKFACCINVVLVFRM